MPSRSRPRAERLLVTVSLLLALTSCTSAPQVSGTPTQATVTKATATTPIPTPEPTQSAEPSAAPPTSLTPSAGTPVSTPLTQAPSTAPPTGYRSASRPLTAAEQQAMTGVSWRPGCPVPLAQLRRLTVSYVDFTGATRQGVLVVHESAVAALTQVFSDLYDARFPIRSMQPIEAYGGDDWTSIEADNTSAFNCRRRTGSTTEWSRHAYGLAIDLNPLENPYVTNGTTSHPRSRPYLDRGNVRAGMVVAGSPAVAAFARIGWSWGGLWANPTDLQHFSDTGR